MSDITPEEFSSKPFDYLIVGGGTAGLVLAARLSENPDVRVGVLEAGRAQFDNPKVKIPGLLGRSIADPELDWAYMTTPQKELGGRKLLYPGGKMLGGSSGLNFMFWGRGDKRDYEWEKDFGVKGWTWDSFLFVIHGFALLPWVEQSVYYFIGSIRRSPRDSTSRRSLSNWLRPPHLRMFQSSTAQMALYMLAFRVGTRM